MKTSFKRCLSMFAIAAMVSTAVFTSCKKEEVTPIPEEVETTIEDVYYITGVVTSSGSALSGAKVSSGSESVTTGVDGIYKLTMSSATTATVDFSMDGYVSIEATALFAKNSKAGTSVTLSQELTKKAESKPVVAGTETTLTFDDSESVESGIVVSIPAAAISEDVAISVTPFIPAATKEATEALAQVADGASKTVTSSLTAISLEPSGITFDEPLTISIPSESIEGAYHAKLVDGEWVEMGDAVYNDQTKSYEIKVDGFSQHSIAVKNEISASDVKITTETLKVETFDNLGEVNTVKSSVNYVLNTGWVLSDTSSSTLSSYVAGLMGSTAGLNKITKDLDVTVAGDQKVTVTITQQVLTTSYTLGSVSVSAKSYGDVSVAISTEQGDMRPDHNI